MVPWKTRTVAVFNASDETVSMLVEALTLRGHRGIGGSVDDVKAGRLDFVAFVEAHSPDGIIWDVAPPYDHNWRFLKLVRGLGALQRCAFVATTTNKVHLDRLIGRDSGATELIGKPYDVEQIVDLLEAAMAKAAEGGPRAIER